jgi:Domain of Unknown Function with PDB structure (DUF3857)
LERKGVASAAPFFVVLKQVVKNLFTTKKIAGLCNRGQLLVRRSYFSAFGAKASFAALAALVLAFLYLPLGLAAEPRILREAFPEWVIELRIPKIRQERARQASGGVYDLLQDTQIRLDTVAEVTFRRSVQQITDRSGLEEAARLQLDFDPETDEIILHRAAIWRDGKMIDQTAMARTEIMRRESELEKDIINNYRTADIRLQDVRIGDTIDFGWSWRTTKSYWPGHHFSEHSLGWSVPVALTQVRLIKSESTKIYSKSSNGAPKPVVKRLGNDEVLTWTVADANPLSSEKDTPAWKEPWAKLELSTMREWAEVASWARPFYDIDESLPSGLIERVDAIATASSDPNVRVTGALRLVQDNVRYTSIPIMSGGYAPRPPKETWVSGFGDCKDKTALLIAVLARLGISAEPALTDIDEGRGLVDALPAANLFDHIIVKVNGLGKPLWVDPTGSHEGGVVPNIASLTYGYALPLTKGLAKLEQIAAPTPSKPTIDIVEKHELHSAGVAIEIRNVYRGDEADIVRKDRADRSADEIDREDLEYFGRLYSGVKQTRETIVRDDRSKNELTIIQHYFLPAEAKSYDDTILQYQINAWSMADLYPTLKISKRVSDIKLPDQINRRHLFKIVTQTRIGLPTDKSIFGDAFAFERKAYRDGASGIVEFTLQGRSSTIGPDRAEAYRQDAARLADLHYEFVDLQDELGGYAGFFLFAGFFFVIGGTGLLIWRVIKTKEEEAAGLVGGILRPIGIGKFCLLGISTAGVYPGYWFWRCWRQHWHKEGASIMPFWRALFGQFWTYALFETARERAEKKLPDRVGVVVLVVYLVLGVVSNLGDRLNIQSPISGTAALLAPLVLVPLVRQVNFANSDALIAANAKLDWQHWLVVVCGAPFTIALLLIG